MRFARIAAGLVVAAVPVVLSGASVAHADTLLNQTCVGSVNIQFGVGPLPGTGYGTTVLGPGPIDSLTYDRGYFVNCQDAVLTDPPLGVQLPTEAHSGRVFGNVFGGCVAALLNGGGDFRNGEGILIGGSVIVAGSTLLETGDVAFAEVDAMVPQDRFGALGIPCLTETAGADLLAVNDTVL